MSHPPAVRGERGRRCPQAGKEDTVHQAGRGRHVSVRWWKGPRSIFPQCSWNQRFTLGPPGGRRPYAQHLHPGCHLCPGHSRDRSRSLLSWKRPGLGVRRGRLLSSRPTHPVCSWASHVTLGLGFKRRGGTRPSLNPLPALTIFQS